MTMPGTIAPGHTEIRAIDLPVIHTLVLLAVLLAVVVLLRSRSWWRMRLRGQSGPSSYPSSIYSSCIRCRSWSRLRPST